MTLIFIYLGLSIAGHVSNVQFARCRVLGLVRDDGDQAQQHSGEQRVERVQRPPLEPLGDGGARVAEPQLLQDVVHAVRLDRLARPRQQPEYTHTVNT